MARIAVDTGRCDMAARAAGLARDGGAVLLVAAARDTAAALEARVRDELGEGSEGVRVATAHEVALAVLADPEVAPQLGRGARMLLDVEWALLVSDLRTRGFDDDEVRRGVARVLEAWDAGEPACVDDPVAAAVLDELALREAVAPREVWVLAAAGLRAAPGAAVSCGAPYVLVEGANLLGPAALGMLAALAGEECLLAGDPAWTCGFFDPAARADAFVHMAVASKADKPRSSVCPRPRAVGAAWAHTVKWDAPQAEADGVAAFVRNELDLVAPVYGDDAEESEASPFDCGIFVAVPNAAYARGIVAALAKEGVEVALCLAPQAVAGDPRRSAPAGTLGRFARLGAEAGDVAAGRLALAAGLADAGCSAWRTLVDTDRAGGPQLAEALGAQVAQGVLGDGAEAFARVALDAASPGFGSRGPRAVCVGVPQSVAALRPRVLVAAGFNEGLVDGPLEPVYRHLFAATEQALLVSYVRRAALDVAARSGAAVKRVVTRGGNELAALAPAPALAALGPAVPPTMSGEQFRAAVLETRR